MADLAANVATAKLQLREIASKARDLYAHRFDREWAPESVSAAQTPSWRPLWLQPTDLHEAYDTVVFHLRQADRLLLDLEDIPAGWMPLGKIDGQELVHGTILVAVNLDRALRLEQNRHVGAKLKQACEEVGAAHASLPAGFKDAPAPAPEPDPTCVNDGCTQPRRKKGHGKECEACAKWRQRKGTPRPIRNEDAA